MPASYPADLYAATHTGTEGDAAFYLAQTEARHSVLELGCGVGRLLEPLARRAAYVEGIERSVAALESARARVAATSSARVTRADFRDFDLGRTFDRVYIPHSGVYCLLDDAALRSCLQSVRRHLRPGGRLILDAYCADDFHHHGDPDALGSDELVPVTSVHVRGKTWQVLEQSRWDRTAQRLDVTYLYVPEDGGEVEVGRIPQHYLLREQVTASLAAAGFEGVQMWGTFAGDACTEDDGIWVASASTSSA